MLFFSAGVPLWKRVRKIPKSGTGHADGIGFRVHIYVMHWNNSSLPLGKKDDRVVYYVTRPGPKGPHRDNPVKSSNLRIAAFVTGLDSVRRQNGPIKYRSFISQEHQAISIRGTRCLVWNKISWWSKWLAMNNQTDWGLNSTLRAEVVNVDSSREYSSNWQRFWAHQRLIFHSRWSPSS